MAKRWKAIISYKPGHMEDKVFTFHEFVELGEEIERGPDWNHINNVTITLVKGEP